MPRRPLLRSPWLKRAVGTLLTLLALAAPLTAAPSGTSEHCAQHSPAHQHAQATGHGSDHTAPSTMPAAPTHHCDHCPPSQCGTTTPCATHAASAAALTRATILAQHFTCTTRAADCSRVMFSIGSKPPTPPPQRT